MIISSNSIENGYLKDEFGKRGTQYLNGKKPNRSFHLSWKDLPRNTKSLALVFIDHDAIPVCGFSWIHWLVANIDPSLRELKENASVENSLIEGITSWNSPLLSNEWLLSKDDAIGFGGCMPPDKDHLYSIELYALNTLLNIKKGFYFNELFKKMQDHILEKANLNAWYKK